MEIATFLQWFTAWCAGRSDVVAAALVGSHARGTAEPDSDVDLVILTTAPSSYFQDQLWAAGYGLVWRTQVEDWGRVQSLRVKYVGGQEVEYGFTLPDWAEYPPDAGSEKVILAGMRVLYDPQGLLKQCQAAVNTGQPDGKMGSGMELTVNGRQHAFDAPLTGAGLLAQLGIRLSTTVAEVNGAIVPRDELAGLELQDGDSIELVTIVGGG